MKCVSFRDLIDSSSQRLQRSGRKHATRSLSPLSRSASKLSKASWESNSNASGILLGSCGIDRRKLVPEHNIETSATCQLADIYDVEEGIVGYGGFGTVRRATLKNAPTVVRAIKTVQKRSLKAQSFVRSEIRVLRRLDHPCICRLLETFEDERAIYLVLEFIDGKELFDEIVEGGSLPEGLASSIMRQVFSALRYCHERNVLHRDLKPDNIMVQHHSRQMPPVSPAMMPPEVKLIDFGLAMITSHEVLGRSGSVIGSADYLAPEAGQISNLPASDVWSAGMVLHAMLCGSLPKWDENTKELDFETTVYKSLSSSARDLLKGLLVLDPSQRLRAAAALAHPWTQGLESRTPKDLTPTLTSFVAFHRSAKLRRAALAALATQLTSWQLRDLREQFLLVDANGDGRISKEDLTMSIALSSPGGAAEDVRSWVEAIFDSVFLEGDRHIEYTEWLAAVLQQGQCVSEEAVRAAFRIFDTDGDGYICQGELGQVLAQTPEEVASFFSDFDTNGDGVLDFNEFKGIFAGGSDKDEASVHFKLHSPCCHSVVSL